MRCIHAWDVTSVYVYSARRRAQSTLMYVYIYIVVFMFSGRDSHSDPFPRGTSPILLYLAFGFDHIFMSSQPRSTRTNFVSQSSEPDSKSARIFGSDGSSSTEASKTQQLESESEKRMTR